MAFGSDKNEYGEIHAATFGIMFLATPHRGSEYADLSIILGNILDFAGSVSYKTTSKLRTDLLKQLAKDSKELNRLLTDSRNVLMPIKLAAFSEQDVLPNCHTLVCSLSI